MNHLKYTSEDYETKNNFLNVFTLDFIAVFTFFWDTSREYNVNYSKGTGAPPKNAQLFLLENP